MVNTIKIIVHTKSKEFIVMHKAWSIGLPPIRYVLVSLASSERVLVVSPPGIGSQ